MMISDLAYGLLSTSIGWLISEAIPILTKGKYGGVLHVIVAGVSKLYGGENSVADLRRDVADLKAAIAAITETPNGSGKA